MTYYYGNPELRALLGDMANAPSYSDILEEPDSLAIGYCISKRCQHQFKVDKIERARRVVPRQKFERERVKGKNFQPKKNRDRDGVEDRIGFPRPICYFCNENLHWEFNRRIK
jgi:hypothetical protein